MKKIRLLNARLTFLAAVLMASAGTLWETDFVGAAGPLSGRDGWQAAIPK